MWYVFANRALTITGHKIMALRFYRSIDWLTFTSPEAPRWKIPSQRVPSPVPFYREARRYSNGALASFGNPNSDKWLVIMSSTAIEQSGFVDEENCREFVRQRVEDGCKFSRVDMAVTVEQSGEFTIETFDEWLQSGKITGPEHRIEQAKGIVDKLANRDETIYLGDQKKRAKKGIIRAYDKSLERGLEPGILTRIEIEEKRAVAHRIAQRFADGAGIGALMKERLWIDTELWRTLTGDETAPDTYYKQPKQPETLDKTWLWLIEKIAPVLGRKIAQDEEFGTGMYTRAFMDALTTATNAEKLTMLDNV